MKNIWGKKLTLFFAIVIILTGLAILLFDKSENQPDQKNEIEFNDQDTIELKEELK